MSDSISAYYDSKKLHNRKACDSETCNFCKIEKQEKCKHKGKTYKMIITKTKTYCGHCGEKIEETGPLIKRV